MPDNERPGVNSNSFDEQRGVWQPVLDGDLQEQALRAIQDVARSLCIPSYDLDYLPESLRKGAAANLSGGDAGLAVFFAYLSRARSEYDDEATAFRLLEQAIDVVPVVPMPAKLHGGFTGIAWAVAHLSGWLVDADEEDPNEAIDDVLLEHLNRSPWTDEYDLIGGLVGFGVYALERLPRPTAVACLDRVIDRLYDTAEFKGEGVTWITPAQWLIDRDRDRFPEALNCLGMAHGVAGVIALLGAACAAGVARERAQPLLEGAVSWLLSHKLTENVDSTFGYWVGPGVDLTPARSAWCHGDPGIAAALFCASRCVGEPGWEREALAIARRVAERPLEQTGVVDAGLCHGAAGLGHMFNRMFQATGEEWLKEAAQVWFERTLAMRRPDRGIAGFSAWAMGKDGTMGWHNVPGILMGASGIALALLAAVTPIEPEWDRMLLISVPPQSS